MFRFRSPKRPSFFKSFKFLGQEIKALFLLFIKFLNFFYFYLRKKVLGFSLYFEKNKDKLVKFFTMKRGRYNRPFLHIATISVLAVGVIIAPFLKDSYPILSSKSSVLNASYASNKEQSITVDEEVFQTDISQKPRDKVITYVVAEGDTISSIGKKFGISEDTIKWANDLKGDYLSIGDELKILPVSGIWHKVSKGESVYTIAKKYDTNPQQIVDFPFNDFANPETFSLVDGQMLIVPDGVPPQEKPVYRRQTIIVQGPVSVSSAGFTWPLQGGISQFASWYHTALDITSDVGTGIVAARSGRVIQALAGTWDGGYGNNIIIDHGDGYQTLYSHMSTFSVGVGDDVTGGKTVIGAVGMTGRTTGPHLHFEIRRGGVLVNPLPYLQ